MGQERANVRPMAGNFWPEVKETQDLLTFELSNGLIAGQSLDLLCLKLLAGSNLESDSCQNGQKVRELVVFD